MSDKKYNGWSNYETWAVKLWLDNEEGSSRYWSDKAEEAYRDATARQHATREEVASYNLARDLKAELEEAAPDLGASLWSDLLGAAMSEVDWDEIAAAYVADNRETVDEEEADSLPFPAR